MEQRTVFLSKLIGLFAVLLSLSMLADKQSSVETVSALVHERPLLMIVGIIGLIAGLALVLMHNVWSGGLVPVIVTLIGWWVLIRSALLILLPASEAVRLFELLRFEQFFFAYMGVSLLVGLFLAYRGFTSSIPLFEK